MCLLTKLFFIYTERNISSTHQSKLSIQTFVLFRALHCVLEDIYVKNEFYADVRCTRVTLGNYLPVSSNSGLEG